MQAPECRISTECLKKLNAPLVNMLPLSFPFTLRCPVCAAGTGSCTQPPFASWHHAKLCQQRVLEGHCRSGALPGAVYLITSCSFSTWPADRQAVAFICSKFKWHPGAASQQALQAAQPASRTPTAPLEQLPVFYGYSQGQLSEVLPIRGFE